MIPNCNLSLPRLMYWSEIGSDPQIEQAGMDGSNRRILINEGLGWPTAITLDLLSWKIFWMDDKFHCIGLASLDGTGIKVMLTKLGLQVRLCLALKQTIWGENQFHSSSCRSLLRYLAFYLCPINTFIEMMLHV